MCGEAYSSLSLLVLYQWSLPWTWRLWSALWRAGRRTQSSSPVRTVSACHLKLRKPTPRTASTFSSWRASSSTTTSEPPVDVFVFSAQALQFNPQASWPLKFSANLSLASSLQAHYWRLWQMFLHFHSLWGVQKEEKVTRSQSDFDKLQLKGEVRHCRL